MAALQHVRGDTGAETLTIHALRGGEALEEAGANGGSLPHFAGAKRPRVHNIAVGVVWTATRTEGWPDERVRGNLDNAVVATGIGEVQRRINGSGARLGLSPRICGIGGLNVNLMAGERLGDGLRGGAGLNGVVWGRVRGSLVGASLLRSKSGCGCGKQNANKNPDATLHFLASLSRAEISLDI